MTKTRDGVEIIPTGDYWRIPRLERRDFTGLGIKLPTKCHLRASGADIELECRREVCLFPGNDYASTKELANRYAVEDYVFRLKFEASELEEKAKALKSESEEISSRLASCAEKFEQEQTTT